MPGSFPLSYLRSFLIRLAYGSLDPATAVSSLCLLGIATGVGVHRARLLPWTAIVLFTRRSREVFSGPNGYRVAGALAGAAADLRNDGRRPVFPSSAS